jgi:stress-induced-phosphoprotein 1
MCTTSEEWKSKGNSAFTEKNYNEAISCFTEAIKLDPKNHVLYSNRSGSYAALGRYEEALNDANKCIELKPDWGKGYSRKGLAEFQLNRLEEAVCTFRAGLKIDSTNVALQDGLKQAESLLNTCKLVILF